MTVTGLVLSLPVGYWENFVVESTDIEFLYSTLMEKEVPLTSADLIVALVYERIQVEKEKLEQDRDSQGDVYLPKNSYEVGQMLVFPAFGWKSGKVEEVRPGFNPDIPDFQVLRVAFEDGEVRQLAAGVGEHVLNTPPEMDGFGPGLDLETVVRGYGEDLQAVLEDELETNPNFVRIAGKWFPRALLVDVNAGHLNLAEAVLDMAGGGPLGTPALLEQIGLSTDVNARLVEFSLDMALQEDARFDEVGPSGEILWYLNRLEPEEVLKPSPFLRYQEIPHDRSKLSEGMLALERQIDDELTPFAGKVQAMSEVSIPLIFPHWRAGTLPLSARVKHLFPTAYEAPRIRFMLVDGDTGQKFPGWVVRNHRYVYGLKEWYRTKGTFPGSMIRIKRSKTPGEVIVQCETRRPTRDWVRTVLVGSDGGVVFAMLKQSMSTAFDERITVMVPDAAALENAWMLRKENQNFENLMIDVVRELARLTPQSHVHAAELYTAINTIRRCPPGPILATLASTPGFIHVGDMHFRFDDSGRS